MNNRISERMALYGPSALSTRELLQVVMGAKATESQVDTIIEMAGSPAGVANLSLGQLQRVRGVGAGTASRIQAAAALSQRWATERADVVQIRTPADVYNLVSSTLGTKEREELWVLLLDTKNQVKRVVKLYRGTLNSCMVRPGEVFSDAVRDNAAQIAICHNHPSGDPSPSPEDIRMTERLVEAGKLLNIEIIDHVIVCATRFLSMKERGLGFR